MENSEKATAETTPEIKHPAAVAATAKRPRATRAAQAKAAKQPAAAPAPTAQADATPEPEAPQGFYPVPELTAYPTPATVPATHRVLQFENPQDMLYLANDLAKFIKDNKLTSEVQSKTFVNVEGWAYAASRLGYMPLVVNCRNVGSLVDGELKYEAQVNLVHLATQQVVGAGWAVCSNKEQGKKFYQEFAISSMAQTRATGKACRNILGWVMKAAGYEATPAEEMEQHNAGQDATQTTTGKATAPAPAAAGGPAEAAPAGLATNGKPVVNSAAALKPLPATGHEGQPIDPAEPQLCYASKEAKEDIIRLLNHPVITLKEKSKMLLNINKLTEARAAESIAKLKKAIEDRQQGQAAAAN